MPKNPDEKRSRILEVAKRRFSHYGLAKTTMAEIAKDLAFSKALLYYYFPDKNSLYVAVIEDVMDELDVDIRSLISTKIKVDDAISIFLEQRVESLKKYFYIIEYTFLISKDVNEDISKVIFNTFNCQKEIVKTILSNGIQNNELQDMDVEENASIFLHACSGMRYLVMKDLKNYFAPEKEEFIAVLGYQKKLAHMFIHGLKK